ncbi:uncharacterized protein TM35_000342440 [Trypanosoma theileri]|uniref:Uncharacterized protein n=1 Tax=Trypanosoma theileri TaxID=67003 RepID=A0A1X0NLI7_9TRYP|nr:uncharacterized protein TM35_000342440 [Trypanosoma theileri]ORC85632.1 hypothetical protein TM35_000342440 [Trypanosoma theileri]
MPPKTSKKVSVAKNKRATKKNNSSSSTVTNVKGLSGTVSTRIASLLDAAPVSDVQNNLVKPVSTTRRNHTNVYERLSTILHSVFLVTMVKMAQLRVSHSDRSITTVVDDRWLGALVRYCGFTVTLTDIIECGAAFCDWLKVTVNVNSNSVPQPSESGIMQEIIPATPTESLTRMIVKLKLLRENVPSIAESVAFLRERWGKSQDWKKDVSLLLQGANPTTLVGEEDNEKKRNLPDSGMSKEKTSSSINNNDVENNNDNDDGISDEQLLAQLSAELRASLSKEKLRSVLEQMRREALGLDAKEQEEITKRQRRERLLSTYDLVRSVLGETRSLCNMGVLIKQMMAQNRFDDDMERLLQQLASLVKYNESGIIVYALDEEEEPQKGKKEEDRVTPLLKIRNVDLTHCTLRDLDSVLLRLDRHSASRAKLYNALQRE